MQRGFTLIELLVALAIMAVMATLGWRVLASMQTAVEINRQHADQVLTLDASLAQWGLDLDALVELPLTRTLEWNGRALHLTRRSGSTGSDGAIVVAWTRASRNGQFQWLRWQSLPFTSREGWQAAWNEAHTWVQSSQDSIDRREVRVTALAEWQVFFYRTGAWGNPLSSSGADPAVNNNLPDGIRLVLTLPQGHPLMGPLVRDWARSNSAGALQ